VTIYILTCRAVITPSLEPAVFYINFVLSQLWWEERCGSHKPNPAELVWLGLTYCSRKVAAISLLKYNFSPVHKEGDPKREIMRLENPFYLLSADVPESAFYPQKFILEKAAQRPKNDNRGHSKPYTLFVVCKLPYFHW